MPRCRRHDKRYPKLTKGANADQLQRFRDAWGESKDPRKLPKDLGRVIRWFCTECHLEKRHSNNCSLKPKTKGSLTVSDTVQDGSNNNNYNNNNNNNNIGIINNNNSNNNNVNYNNNDEINNNINNNNSDVNNNINNNDINNNHEYINDIDTNNNEINNNNEDDNDNNNQQREEHQQQQQHTNAHAQNSSDAPFESSSAAQQATDKSHTSDDKHNNAVHEEDNILEAPHLIIDKDHAYESSSSDIQVFVREEDNEEGMFVTQVEVPASALKLATGFAKECSKLMPRMSGLIVSDVRWRYKSILFRANRIPFPDPLLTDSYLAPEETTTQNVSAPRPKSAASQHDNIGDPKIVHSMTNAGAGVANDVLINVVNDIDMIEPVETAHQGTGDSGVNGNNVDVDMNMAMAMAVDVDVDVQPNTNMNGTERSNANMGGGECPNTNMNGGEHPNSNMGGGERHSMNMDGGGRPNSEQVVNTYATGKTDMTEAALVESVPVEQIECCVKAETVLLRNANLVFFDVAMMYPQYFDAANFCCIACNLRSKEGGGGVIKRIGWNQGFRVIHSMDPGALTLAKVVRYQHLECPAAAAALAITTGGGTSAQGSGNGRRSTVFNGLHEKLWGWYHPVIRMAYPWVLKRHAVDKTLLKFLKLVSATHANESGDHHLGLAASGLGAVSAAMHRYELACSDALQRLIDRTEQTWRDVEQRVQQGHNGEDGEGVNVNVNVNVEDVHEEQLVSNVFRGSTYAQGVGSDYLRNN